MKLKYTVLFFFISFASFAQNYSGPESVEFDYTHNRWLISNTTSHQVLQLDSTGVLSVFISGLSSGPYGIEIVGDTLYCCAGNSIKGYSLSNASPVFNLNLGATFLNGIAHDNSGNLYATDFSAKTIYKVNIQAQSDTMIASGLGSSPNGIIYDEANNRCVFVSWGSNPPIRGIDLSSYAVSTITPTSLGSCDGIARDGHGRYYVSNWLNQSVVRYDSDFVAPPVTIVSSLSNPADIFYNVLSDTLAIPNAGNNTVTFFGFSTVSIQENDMLEGISLFPNPASDFTFIKINLNKPEQIAIEVYSLSGQKISESLQNGKMGVNRFPVYNSESSFPRGIYLVKIKSGVFTKSLRLIVN